MDKTEQKIKDPRKLVIAELVKLGILQKADYKLDFPQEFDAPFFIIFKKLMNDKEQLLFAKNIKQKLETLVHVELEFWTQNPAVILYRVPAFPKKTLQIKFEFDLQLEIKIRFIRERKCDEPYYNFFAEAEEKLNKMEFERQLKKTLNSSKIFDSVVKKI